MYDIEEGRFYLVPKEFKFPNIPLRPGAIIPVRSCSVPSGLVPLISEQHYEHLAGMISEDV